MINFVLIALVIFFTLRAIVAMEQELGMEIEKEEKPEPEPPEDTKLLTEIRDLMKDNSDTARAD